jgi:hypothetical protein
MNTEFRGTIALPQNMDSGGSNFYLHLQDVGNRVTLWTLMSPLFMYFIFMLYLECLE